MRGEAEAAARRDARERARARRQKEMYQRARGKLPRRPGAQRSAQNAWGKESKSRKGRGGGRMGERKGGESAPGEKH